ncbi:MAG: cysteine--tRNA ligase [Anaerolineales bacterium]|nr:cysteine--tRNA ligase [Anaerolineales bacterium]
MPLRLFDTYERRVREFTPLDPAEVRLYACGLTVYDYAHIGNLRTYIFEDVLRRVLEYNGYRVLHVQNVTDVGHLVSDADTGEDKMEKGSRRTGKSAWEIAEFYFQAFQADLARLNVLPPHIWPRATDHIAEQIDLIRCIEAKGYTYLARDGVYFDTSRLPDYGYLARLDLEGQQAGARVEVGEKRSPTDFALWKFSAPGEQRQMEWPSPWGAGFPGWHIECSAMAAKYLGPFFDIHCGGEDHIMVHHPNEIAQTQVCYGTRLANFWMHGYFLQVDEAKMSKSAGEFLRLQTLIDRGYDPLAWRFFCLGAHYRAKLNFTWEALEGAATAFNRLRIAAHEWSAAGPGTPDAEFLQRFQADINDDLNMPRVLALAWELARGPLPPADKRATLLEFDRVMGLGLAEWQPSADEVPAEIAALLERRQQARREKRWQDADALRAEVRSAGFEVEDTPQGPVARRAR